jgi:hypothetical protein
MVEQQIEIKILVPDFKVIFAAEECKSDPRLDKEIPEFFKERHLKFPLGYFGASSQEIKDVRIPDKLKCEI